MNILFLNIYTLYIENILLYVCLYCKDIFSNSYFSTSRNAVVARYVEITSHYTRVRRVLCNIEKKVKEIVFSYVS